MTSAKVFYTNPGARIFYGIMFVDAAWVAYNGIYYGLYGPGFVWTSSHGNHHEGPYNVNETAEESLEFGLPMPYERRRYLIGTDPEEFPGLMQTDSQSKIAGWGSS